ncbi:hypothetical protein [Thermosulfurimonas sp. F29]|uniref:hypothetical protein n=1 Tax=Thermosulfurimonas sp. F29 TaxID=2867247 RepID=UPI001C82F743|nr:hypothetical protein [Thermosulfurimonas sp. F29]MBX6422348.1 hypothetical protein [Thermosulfurimonas sp. F29]
MKKKLWFFAVLILIGCTRGPLESTPSVSVHTIAVLPFEAACPGGKGEYFSCPIQGLVAGEIIPEAPRIMDDLLQEALSGHPGFRFVSRREFEGIWEEVLAEAHEPRPADIVRMLGKVLGTEALLYGKVFRFRERKGRGYAVKRPASVAFALVLFDTKNGHILWKGWFDETQQPLSRNLFKIRLYGGVRWLTAEELARRGLERTLQDFPFPKTP